MQPCRDVIDRVERCLGVRLDPLQVRIQGWCREGQLWRAVA